MIGKNALIREISAAARVARGSVLMFTSKGFIDADLRILWRVRRV